MGRIIDLLLMAIFTWFIYLAISDRDTKMAIGNLLGISISHTRLIFLSIDLTIIIYILLYRPLLDSIAGGTIGKFSTNQSIVDRKSRENISIANSYKRILFVAWPLLVFVIINILIMKGVISNDMGNVDDDVDDEANGMSSAFFILFVVFVLQLFIYLGCFVHSKKGQSYHDKVADAILVHEITYEETIDEMIYEAPQSFFIMLLKFIKGGNKI
ncbi:MAG TPA: RDD family protein [Flavipsychrobacter sp.]|nr:RDD family protein [Flavipsychrobacter sp.]